MFTAATAAASADIRSKRQRFASHRSFSASEINGIKRRQKAQTANALDILSTYLVTSTEDTHHGRLSSNRGSRASSRESSRAHSPIVEEMNAASFPPNRSNSASARSSTSFLSQLFSSTPHQPGKDQPTTVHQSSLPLPSLNSSLSHSTSSIDSNSLAATVGMLRDPGWSEIARLSHSDDLDDVDSHGNRCGHRRGKLYDRQANPFGAYVARKRFISAINRIRMESMVCSALSDASQPQRPPSSLQHRSSQGSNSSTSPNPPAVVLFDQHGDKATTITDDDSLSIAELHQEIEQISSTTHFRNFQYPQSSGRASSSPVIPDTTETSTWTPLMQGRSIERSASSSLSSVPANFTSDSQQVVRQRSSSATSDTSYLEGEESNQNLMSSEKKSKGHSGKHSFMALVRIKMYSLKRHRAASTLPKGDSMKI